MSSQPKCPMANAITSNQKKNICKKRSPLSYISSQVSYHSGYILENSMIIYILPFELFMWWQGLTVSTTIVFNSS